MFACGACFHQISKDDLAERTSHDCVIAVDVQYGAVVLGICADVEFVVHWYFRRCAAKVY